MMKDESNTCTIFCLMRDAWPSVILSCLSSFKSQEPSLFVIGFEAGLPKSLRLLLHLNIWLLFQEPPLLLQHLYHRLQLLVVVCLSCFLQDLDIVN